MASWKEGPQNNPDIDWGKELGPEINRNSFNYVIPRDSTVIERFVAAAVYKTLSGEEIALKARNNFVEDSSLIGNEVMEHEAIGLMEQARRVISGDNGYEREQEEAMKQGRRANESVNRLGEFNVRYDYWGVVPIKSGVSISRIDGFPDYLRLRSGLSEISGKLGFPDRFLHREVRQDDLAENEGDTIIDFAKNVSEKLGIDFSDFLQSIFNGEKGIFVEAMNKCGHIDFDPIRTAIVYSGEGDHKLYSLAEQFKMLSKKEKKVVQEPVERSLFGDFSREIVSGGSRAIFLCSAHVGGDVWYNSKKKKIEGKIIPSHKDAIYVSLMPIITPQTTHQELLDIRRKAQKLAKELGFPERRTINW